MYAGFKYENIALTLINLDNRNPRIVTQKKLATQDEILKYLFDHEDLDAFIKKIASEGKNPGAERPYVIKTGKHYTVVEGNSRVAAYKILTGLLDPPSEYASSIPHVSESVKATLLTVDCSVAPDRDSLLPIVANSHFGRGDKNRWSYLGSRKAVYDEWQLGKTIPKLSKVFGISPREAEDLILEYLLYLKALSLHWTKKEKNVLLSPSVQFNPPIRFLETGGHKQKLGVSFDHANLKVVFAGAESLKRFKHMLTKLVIKPERGLGATASYDDVFADYPGKKSENVPPGKPGKSKKGRRAKRTKSDALFGYPVTLNNGLLKQLMKEASEINCKKYPACGTLLLRSIVEAVLKHKIEDQKANSSGKMLDLEGAINLCLSHAVKMDGDDKKVLKEFSKHHLSYLNLGSHGSVIPNPDRLASARDCVDQFIKKNV